MPHTITVTLDNEEYDWLAAASARGGRPAEEIARADRGGECAAAHRQCRGCAVPAARGARRGRLLRHRSAGRF